MRNVSLFLLIIGVFLSLSCSNDPKYRTASGENIIPADSLESIIYDVHMADAIITSKIMKTKNSKKVDSLIYVSVFAKHKYSRAQFEQTLLYYTHNNIDSLNRMYDRVIERLNIEKGKIY